MIYIFFWFNVYSMLTTLFWSFLSSFPTAFFRSSVIQEILSLQFWLEWFQSWKLTELELLARSKTTFPLYHVPSPPNSPPPQSLPQNHTTAPGSQLEFFRVWSSQPFIAYFLPFRLAFRCFPPLPLPPLRWRWCVVSNSSASSRAMDGVVEGWWLLGGSCLLVSG